MNHSNHGGVEVWGENETNTPSLKDDASKRARLPAGVAAVVLVWNESARGVIGDDDGVGWVTAWGVCTHGCPPGVAQEVRRYGSLSEGTDNAALTLRSTSGWPGSGEGSSWSCGARAAVSAASTSAAVRGSTRIAGVVFVAREILDRCSPGGC